MTLQRDDAPGSSPALREAALLTRLEGLSADLARTGGIPALDEDVRRATRQRLVAMAAVRSPEVRPARLRRLLTAGAGPRWRTRLTAGLAGAAMTVTALGGLVAAAQGAGPGDLLYDVKRGGERTQLALAGDSSRGPTLLGFASTRLQELDRLTRQGATALPAGNVPQDAGPAAGQVVLAAGPDAALVVRTLRTMDRQTTDGTWWSTTSAVQTHDAARLEELSRWADGQQRGLAGVTGALPAGATDAASAAAQLLTAVLDRADGLRSALACPGGPATDGSDALGPRPAPCPVAPPVADRSGASTGTAPGTGSSSAARTGSSASPAPGAPASSAASSSAAAPAPSGSEPPGGSGAPGHASTGHPPATSAAPSTRTRGGLPLPLPLPLPSGSARPTGPATSSAPTTTAPSSGSPLIDLPPLVPGVTLCVPPLLGIGCR